MKKKLILLPALAFILAAAAQEPSKFRFAPTDSLPAAMRFDTVDSLARRWPDRPDYRTAEFERPAPAVSMTSVVIIPQHALPARVTVLDNNTLRMGQHFNISKGQAARPDPGGSIRIPRFRRRKAQLRTAVIDRLRGNSDLCPKNNGRRRPLRDKPHRTGPDAERQTRTP